MKAKYIGVISFKSKKGVDCYVVNYALFDEFGNFLRCSQEFVKEENYTWCIDNLSFGECLEVRTFINQFGQAQIGLIYE